MRRVITTAFKPNAWLHKCVLPTVPNKHWLNKEKQPPLFRSSYLFLLTKRNPKRIHAFMKKKAKTLKFSICSAVSHYRGSPRSSAARAAPPSFFSGNCAGQASYHSFDSVCEILCFILIYFEPLSKMCPKVPEKPKKAYFLGLRTLKKFSM